MLMLPEMIRCYGCFIYADIFAIAAASCYDDATMPLMMLPPPPMADGCRDVTPLSDTPL